MTESELQNEKLVGGSRMTKMSEINSGKLKWFSVSTVENVQKC